MYNFQILPVSFAENHTHMDVLEIQNTDCKVCTKYAGQEDDIPLDVFEHEDYANHVQNNQQDFNYNPIECLPFDL